MLDIGIPELILILVVVLIVFGAGKLPEIGGAIGKGIREFRKAQRGDYDEDGKHELKKTDTSDASDQAKK